VAASCTNAFVKLTCACASSCNHVCDDMERYANMHSAGAGAEAMYQAFKTWNEEFMARPDLGPSAFPLHSPFLSSLCPLREGLSVHLSTLQYPRKAPLRAVVLAPLTDTWKEQGSMDLMALTGISKVMTTRPLPSTTLRPKCEYVCGCADVSTCVCTRCHASIPQA
jgi:hypothetical protein